MNIADMTDDELESAHTVAVEDARRALARFRAGETSQAELAEVVRPYVLGMERFRRLAMEVSRVASRFSVECHALAEVAGIELEGGE